MADQTDNAASERARQFMELEGEQIVRDLAGHFGEDLFELMRRHGMKAQTAAGAMAILVLSAAQIMAQAHDFVTRTIDDPKENDDCAELIMTVFAGELPDVLQKFVALREPSAEVAANG